MGGNGFYWVTSIDPERPHIIEVRRWGGTQAWRSEPGEYIPQQHGRDGRLVAQQGRAPQKMVGVGSASEGFDHNVRSRRLPDSTGPEAAFIFEGIGLDESIGDFDCLIQDSGAAGQEGRPLRPVPGDASCTRFVSLPPLDSRTPISSSWRRSTPPIPSREGRSIPSCGRTWSTSSARPTAGVYLPLVP